MSTECTNDRTHTDNGHEIPQDKTEQFAPLNERSAVRKVIAVVSGKGGVGKSLITSLLAVHTNRKGLHTAILDADITGPSIPKTFHLNEHATGNSKGIFPVKTKTGISVMSLNLLLENETDPVIWRGPAISGIIKQFWKDVVWDDIDVMFVDMPPGTGDVSLTVFQSLPLDGIIIVTTPQELVEMIVEKAVKMAELMHIPIMGIVENMSYFTCPDCGRKYNIFGESSLAQIAARHGIPLICKIPLDQDLSASADSGKIEEYEDTCLAHMADAITNWER